MRTATEGDKVTVFNHCMWCQRESSVVVDREGFEQWDMGRGEYVQVAFPNLSASEREILISGTHPECWDEMWGSENEEE